MTGQQLWEAARDGDAAKVSTLLSTQDAQSFINYQDVLGVTPLHGAVFEGLGRCVVINGLVAKPELNRCTGTVVIFGHCSTRLSSTTAPPA